MSITPTLVPLEAPVAVAGTLAFVAAGCACANARPANRRAIVAKGRNLRVIVELNSSGSRQRLPSPPLLEHTSDMVRLFPTSSIQDRGFDHYTNPAEHMAITLTPVTCA